MSTAARRRGSARLGAFADMVDANLSSRLRKMTCRVRAESARPQLAALPQGTPVVPRLRGSSVPDTVWRELLAIRAGDGIRRSRGSPCLAGRDSLRPLRSLVVISTRTIRPRAGICEGGVSSRDHARTPVERVSALQMEVPRTGERVVRMRDSAQTDRLTRTRGPPRPHCPAARGVTSGNLVPSSYRWGSTIRLALETVPPGRLAGGHKGAGGRDPRSRLAGLPRWSARRPCRPGQRQGAAASECGHLTWPHFVRATSEDSGTKTLDDTHPAAHPTQAPARSSARSAGPHTPRSDASATAPRRAAKPRGPAATPPRGESPNPYSKKGSCDETSPSTPAQPAKPATTASNGATTATSPAPASASAACAPRRDEPVAISDLIDTLTTSNKR